MTPIKVGLVGAGYISDWHADTLRAIDGVDVVAVCDPSLGNAGALAAKHGAQVFPSLTALIEAGIADAVHILTPPQFHRDLAVEALNGGLHCLVEKPVALSQAETRDIVEAANTSGKHFAAGHNFMGLPSYQRLKSAVDAGTLGRVSSAEINWHFPLTPLRSGPYGLWLLRDPQNLLLELGPHLFGFVVDLFGMPEVEHLSLGKSVTFPDGTTRPQSLRMVARAGDVDLNVNITLVETADDRSVIIRGSGGVARLDYAADTLIINRENASDIVVNPLQRQISLAGQNLREGAVNATRQVTSLYQKSPYGISFMGLFNAFYDAIKNDTPADPRFNGSAAIKVMTAVEGAIALMPENPAPVHIKTRDPKPDALVIGGTGFIGRRLTEVLVARGHDVRVLSRGRSSPFAHLPENVEIFSASLKDAQGLAAAMDGIKAVYHLGKSHEVTWQACLENDVEVTVGIARAAMAAGVERFVYTGTIASYDMSDPEQTITETTGFGGDMEDRNLYARSKAECERRLVEMQRAEGLPLTIARPGIVVGAGGPLQHWGIGRWHGAGAVRIWGRGYHTLPFVLIDDVAEALVRIIEVDAAIGESVNLIGEPMLSARDYFDAIHDQLGARIIVKPGSLHLFFATDTMKYLLKRYGLRRKGLVRASLSDWKSRAHYSPFDNRHAKTLLDWQPETDKKDFVRRAIVDANLFGF
ncbi:MAG: NAD-dependent epimerase/dehydratase family protein [Rhodobacterales bacterium]|nr:NAD-dependent epimerase/dehydratase family protein [Rhodobacterales bacterium]